MNKFNKFVLVLCPMCTGLHGRPEGYKKLDLEEKSHCLIYLLIVVVQACQKHSAHCVLYAVLYLQHCSVWLPAIQSQFNQC